MVLEPFRPSQEELTDLELGKDQQLCEEVKRRFTKVRADDLNSWVLRSYRCGCKAILTINEE